MLLEQQASVKEQQASFEKMVQELAARDQEIERLKALIDKLKRMHFGRKSEQLDRQIENLETRLEELTAGRGTVDVQHAKTGQGQGREQQGTRFAGVTARRIGCAKRSYSNPIRPARSAALRCRCSVKTCPNNLSVPRQRSR
ncbi:MAG: hypothetical protein VB142_02985 [Burkholderia sp.]